MSAVYDRAFLLSPQKRDQLMDLWEVQRYGRDSFGDPDYVCIYGMKPEEWYGRGIRLLARTTVEAVRDSLGDLIGQDVDDAARTAPPASGYVVIDPFAGSCNSLYWLLRHRKDSTGLGFEIDSTIFELTRRNLSHLVTTIELVCGDYRSLLPDYRFPADRLLIVFVAPPWGEALSPTAGLDLLRTRPPVGEVVDFFESMYRANPVLYVTQVHQNIVPESLADYVRRFDWSELKIYDINAEGMKHGVLLGSKRWAPAG